MFLLRIEKQKALNETQQWYNNFCWNIQRNATMWVLLRYIQESTQKLQDEWASLSSARKEVEDLKSNCFDSRYFLTFFWKKVCLSKAKRTWTTNRIVRKGKTGKSNLDLSIKCIHQLIKGSWLPSCTIFWIENYYHLNWRRHFF